MKTYKSNMRKLSLKEEKSDYNKVKITNSKEAYQTLKPFFEPDMTIYESFFILLLNNANNTIGHVKISQGGITGTMVDVKIIAKYAIETLAMGVILAHNHPSGTLKPSQADIHITKKVKECLDIFDCKVLDHIILTEDNFYSLADNRDM